MGMHTIRWRSGATDSGQIPCLPMLGLRQCALFPFPACWGCRIVHRSLAISMAIARTLARISRRTRSDRSPFRSNADDLFACSLQALRSHRDQSGTLRRSPMSATEVATIIKLQPTARAYRIIPLCTRGRSICLQQTETIASQAVSYYCFIPRPPAPCAPPAPYGPGSAPAALAPYLPLGRLHSHRAYR